MNWPPIIVIQECIQDGCIQHWCIQETVPHGTDTQTALFSRLMNVAYLKHMRTNISYFKRKNFYDETNQKTSNFFFKNHFKSKCKIPEVGNGRKE